MRIIAVAIMLSACNAAYCWAQPNREIGELILQLDDDSFQTREEAQRRLVEIGQPAVAAIRQACEHKSLEVRLRAKAILQQISQQMHEQMLGPGLVLYLPMNEQQLALRRSKEPQCVADRGGTAGQSLLFPGKGYLVVPDNPILDTDDEFTLAAWIKPTKITYRRWKGHQGRDDEPTFPWSQQPASWSGHFIASKWYSEGSNGDYLLAITPSGRLGLGVSNNVRGYVADGLYTDLSVAVGKWQHVAGTFDHGEIKLYIDGKLQCSKRSTTVLHTNRREYFNDDIYIGDFWNQQAGEEYNFCGAIDDFCIFNRALPEQEIQRVMRLFDKDVQPEEPVDVHEPRNE